MKNKNELRVLVTDGNNRASLAITRSLGKAGYKVFVAGETKRNLAGSSRYCTRRLFYTDPVQDPDRFRIDIIGMVQQCKIDILMPAAEITTRECMKIVDDVRTHCVIPFHSYDSVDVAASKYQVLKLASKLSVPIPKTIFLHAPEEVEQAIQFGHKIGYPLVVKTSRSKVAGAGSQIKTSGSTYYAHCADDLRRIISNFDAIQYPLLIQERIYGDGVGIFACFDRGKEIAYFSHRRIREKPPSGGVSVLRESFPIDPELKKQASELLNALHWHGVAMVEFKQDKKSGGYKLMEINGRFWGSLQLAIDAGVDFPLLLAQIASGKNVNPVKFYKVKVKTRWLWGDIDALLAIIFKRKDRLNLPRHFPSKREYLKNFINPCRENLNFEVLKFNDPLPWLFESIKWFNFL